MSSNSTSRVIQLLSFGLILAIFKLIYSFLDPYNILDLVIFLAAGYLLGGKVPSNQKVLGLLLALPAFVLCLFFVKNLGYTNIVNGVGTSFALSLIVIPVATIIGVLIKSKRIPGKIPVKTN